MPVGNSSDNAFFIVLLTGFFTCLLLSAVTRSVKVGFGGAFVVMVVGTVVVITSGVARA